MRSQNGFTLVEAIVVGIISSILAGMFIAFMYVHNDAVNRGVARAILLTQSEIVSDRIAAAVRNGNGVFAGGEPWSANPQLAVCDTAVIEIRDNQGVTTALFFIGPITSRLYEGTTMGNLKLFKTGKDTVTTTTGSSFSLSADRKRVTLNLGLRIQYRGKTYSLPLKKDMYVCRN
jgi:type II secretory pathway pseudopilin PulG